MVPLGFSRLIVRLEGSDEIGIAGADFHVRLLEHMRARGFAAVGAENLVFDKDESNRAQFMVGGTVKEVACDQKMLKISCRIGVEWQLLDVSRDRVVYTAMVRPTVMDLPSDRKEHMAGLLLDAAMDRLLDRPHFREALVAHPDSDDSTPAFAEATIPRCAPGSRVAADANDVLGRVVVVKTHNGFGSGFFVSPDGLVMTAAHVVEDTVVMLRLHDGTEAKAIPVRVAHREDVALLRTETPLTGQRCLPLRSDTAPAGTEVYAVGAPASLALAFSLTRGIVSGYPVFSDQRRLQTDASVNPGNSGGPIVDASGAALGVVSFKVVSAKVEGLAFAVPVTEALRALNLHEGATTDPRLLQEKADVEDNTATAAFTDRPDRVPSLDPDGDRRRAAERKRDLEWDRQRQEEAAATRREAAAEADVARRTPGYIPVMRWGGLVVGVAGFLGVIETFSEWNRDSTTQSQFDSLRTWNTVSWTAAALGTSAFALSFVLKPLVLRTSSIHVDPTGVRYSGTF
jgi:S1-C subfamily serine protease